MGRFAPPPDGRRIRPVGRGSSVASGRGSVSECRPGPENKALGIVYRTIATHLTRKAGYTKKTAHTGAVTLIQRFGGALNLNKQS